MSDNTSVSDEKVKQTRAKSVDAATFITIYQSSETVAEVAEKTGLSPHTVSQRASQMRKKHNVNLRPMPNLGTGGARNDWDELRALAARLRPEEESVDSEDDSTDATSE